VDVPSVASTGPSPPPTFDFARMRRLRVFAGTSDPNDSTRFRIPFEFDGTPGTINGRPDEDGQVSLRPTLGTTTADPPSSVASTPRPRSRTWRLTPATDAP
ncbi:MAG TPA: hypothetical protein VK324_11490, partial [Tepidisphaeraceae bacterium]|nr:hypothetical protein [Tepidisphaeraceae bacterium]